MLFRSEDILVNLRNSSQHALGQLSLSDEVSPFVNNVLAAFDNLNMPQLLAERRRLAAGSSTTSDVSLPIGFQRTVIREALSDLRILDLVQTLTDPSASMTTNIPYETRNTRDRKSTRLNSSHIPLSRMPSSA